MDGNERAPRRSLVATPSLALVDLPEVDEFDLDLRLGELARPPGVTWLATPFDAQTDNPCPMPTGGRGAGTTCDTHDNTCAGTCDGLNTCPNTHCGNTCAATCPATQCNTCHTCDTCPATHCDCDTFNAHVNTCRSPCQPR